jgi:serine/threonine protein kinase
MGLTRKNRKQYHGGMSIQGAQGCVTIPSLVVDRGTQTRNANYITKLFFTEIDFNEEKSHNDKVLASVDPTGQFTSAAYDTKPIDIKRIRPEETEECPSLKGLDLSKLKYMNMKFLGRSMQSIIDKVVQYKTSDVRNLMNALAKLAQHVYDMNVKDFYHNDIHPGNVMYDKNLKKAYLIDFGFLGEPKRTKLIDLQGLVSMTRVLLTQIVNSKTDLTPSLKELITQFIKRSGNVLSSTAGFESEEDAQKVLTKLLLDFAKVLEVSGGRRKTKKNRRL